MFRLLSAEAKATLVSRLLFGVSVFAFGIQNLECTGFLAGLEFVPEHIPAHTFWAYFTGIVLVASGIVTLAARQGWVADLVLGVGFLASTLLALPLGVAKPHDLSERTRIFEMLALCGGALLLAANSAPLHRKRLVHRAGMGGRLLLAVSLAVFGIDHLEIPKFIATLIPFWIPWRLFWAYLTGFGFIAASISIAFAKRIRTAGLLLALMFFSWVVLLHGPRVWKAVHNSNEWNSAFVALALSGCALAAALSPEKLKKSSSRHLSRDFTSRQTDNHSVEER